MGGQKRLRGAHHDPPRVPADSVDALLASWRTRRPDLDFTPVGIITRLGRLRGHFGSEIEAVFAQHGLGSADFAVLVTLARVGDDHAVNQRRLMNELGLTSGTISVRMDRLVAAGLVDRRTDPDSKRTTLITLTEHGRDVFEQVAPAHLANERRLLAALTDNQRDQLADLLRILLVEFEGSSEPVDGVPRLGLTLAPAHVAIALRQSVGLPTVPGLLVRAVDPAGPSATAGIRTGDVLHAIGDHELRGIAALNSALQASPARTGLEIRLLRGLVEHRVTIHNANAPRPPARTAKLGGRTTRGEHQV